MKKIKLSGVLIAILLGIFMAFGFAACGSSPSVEGKFYTLQEAYDVGYLTKSDLETIAYYFNEEIAYPEVLDSEIEKAIKETAAEDWRNQGVHSIPEAIADDFVVLKYYGAYYGSYVIMLNEPYTAHPADIVDDWVEIGGVQFHFRGHYSISVWKMNT